MPAGGSTGSVAEASMSTPDTFHRDAFHRPNPPSRDNAVAPGLDVSQLPGYPDRGFGEKAGPCGPGAPGGMGPHLAANDWQFYRRHHNSHTRELAQAIETLCCAAGCILGFAM
jgi:hypothetical protein